MKREASSVMYVLLIVAAAVTVAAQNIFVATYDGKVHTVHYDGDGGLEDRSNTAACGENPTWLTYDHEHNKLWCLDERKNSDQGAIVSFDASEEGELTQINTRTVSSGPVHAKFINNRTGFAVARYGSQESLQGGVSTFNITDFTLSEGANYTFSLFRAADGWPGIQDVARAQAVVPDPTGKFLVVPDLGSDCLRIFTIQPNNVLTDGPIIQAPPGSGPRHAVFWSPNPSDANSALYLFVVSELANTITVYYVSYPDPSRIAFMPTGLIYDTFGGLIQGQQNCSLVTSARASELSISPDNKYIVVSNRNDFSFSAPAPENFSDSLMVLKPTLDLFGSLRLDAVQLANAGGQVPRHFSFNEQGDRIAIGTRTRLIILKLNTEGKFDDVPAATLEIDSKAGGEVDLGISNVLWQS